MRSTLNGGSVGKVHGHTLEDFESSSFFGSFELKRMVFDELGIDEVFFIGPDSTNAILPFDLFVDAGDEFFIEIRHE